MTEAKGLANFLKLEMVCALGLVDYNYFLEADETNDKGFANL